MEYRVVGSTGIKVSSLCFGTMPFGGYADKEMSKAMFERCLDAGINCFDSADIYNQGVSEEYLGEFMQGHRDRLVITSKVCGQMGGDINARGLSRRHIMRSAEESLRRLQTDRIDIYYLHNMDPDTPMEEPLRALDDLQRQGKIVYPAVSNWPAWEISKALTLSDCKGWAGFACMQPMYNLVKRQAEVELLPMAAAEGLGVFTYSPLGGGLLTGKYARNVRPREGRLIENATYGKRYGDTLYYEVAERFAEYAQDQGYHPVTLGVAWVMAHPHVTAPIIGARNLEQLEPSLKAADVQLSESMRQEISRLSPAPPPATDRSETQ